MALLFAIGGRDGTSRSARQDLPDDPRMAPGEPLNDMIGVALDQLAALAHGLWCARMAAQGWRHGPSFDPDRRTHDALVPYEQLAAHDRRTARLNLQSSGLLDKLVAAVEYPRGPDRPFGAHDLRVGLAVGWSGEGRPRRLRDVPLSDRGDITGWETDPDGQITLIHVRWADGRMASYDPYERALIRLAELRDQ